MAEGRLKGQRVYKQKCLKGGLSHMDIWDIDVRGVYIKNTATCLVIEGSWLMGVCLHKN